MTHHTNRSTTKIPARRGATVAVAARSTQKGPNAKVKTATTESLRVMHDRWDTSGFPADWEHALTDRGLIDDIGLAQLRVWIDRLGNEISMWGAYRAVEQFLTARHHFDDRCDRWATVRILEVLTDPASLPRIWPGWTPEDPHARRRPLRPLELCAMRVVSITNTGAQSDETVFARAGAVGALEAGAVSGELGQIHPTDLERDSDGTVVAFRARGTERDFGSGFSVAVPRRLVVPMWARAAFTYMADTSRDRVDPKAPVLLGADSTATDPDKIQSTILMRVRGRLNAAALAGDPAVQPASIRNGTARLVRDRDGLEAAAAQLGHLSLDVVIGEIGLATRKQVRGPRTKHHTGA